MEPKPGKIERPKSVTILAILTILIGLFAIATSTIFLFQGNVTLLNFLGLAFGILFLPAGIGLLRGNVWLGWGLSILISIFSILQNIGEAYSTGTPVYSIPGIIIPAVIIGYLMRPNVKAFFSPE